MCLKNFFISEDCAIAVDWVVLTAGLVGLGIATSFVVAGGVSATSTNIFSGLSAVNMNLDFRRALEQMTPTSIWNDPTNSTREFHNVDALSFSAEVAFSPSDEGILFESGGSWSGFALYQHDGVLYLQAGDGRSTGEAPNRGEATWQVTEGTHNIEGSMNADGGLALYVNGDLVDQSSFQHGRLAGGDWGTVGGAANDVAVNRGGYNRNSAGHPGIAEVTFYEGQTSGDELAPLD